MESDPDGASVTGSNLWNVAVFFDDQADCLGNAFPGTRTTDGSLSDLPVRAGQTLSLTRPFFVMNLQNLACPSVSSINVNQNYGEGLGGWWWWWHRDGGWGLLSLTPIINLASPEYSLVWNGIFRIFF